MNQLLKKIWNHLPLLLVCSVAIFIAFKNIKLTYWYTGWDNIHGEFDLVRYARQVIFGGWLEHQGTGAPMSLGHLSEVFRLPILFVLKILLPDNLVRYVFIFLMYLIGGLSMYFLITKAWIQSNSQVLKNWLGGLGALLYLLHVLTLQQFYISFELFTIQFAYLPLVLLCISSLVKRTNLRNILLFLLLQLLIGPSGHTPTLFYLGVLMTVTFAFFRGLQNGLVKAISVSFFIGILTFIANAYWIIPNFYFAINDSHYVAESRENRIFGPESLWSIKEAGTVSNFLKGTHYLMTWKDYSFEKGQHEYIFNEWLTHLNSPLISALLHLIGIITVLGAVLLLFDKTKGPQRWAIFFTYFFCVSFIWIDLFPTSYIVNELFKSKSFLETFRNPFTKLSIIYSIVSVLVFVETFQVFFQGLHRIKFFRKIQTFVTVSLCVSAALMIGYTALPSFQGHFLSEKLQVKYPTQYKELYKYLNTRDRNLRILQLPQLSHAGWEYYDWQFLGKGNGYQGLGFVFFGFPQALLNRDSDRWVETSDFFYHELKYAIDIKDARLLSTISQKYNVDLIYIDETRIEPGIQHTFIEDHQLAEAAGFKQIWKKDFLSLYERQSDNANQEVLLPAKVSFVNAETGRVRKDVVFSETGDYIQNQDPKTIRYPFTGLLKTELSNIQYSDNTVTITQSIPKQEYTVEIPGIDGEYYFTPAEINYQGQKVNITFPRNKLLIGNSELKLPQLDDITFNVPFISDSIVVFFNDLAIFVEKDKKIYPVIRVPINQELLVEYASKPDEIQYLSSGNLNVGNLTMQSVEISQPNWETFIKPVIIEAADFDSISVRSNFSPIYLDLQQNISLNCATPEQGSIKTEVMNNITHYEADKFAVNCNGNNLDVMSPTYSYLVQVKGNNYQGRGIKFFLTYVKPKVLPEDYLLSAQEFDSTFVFLQASDDPLSIFNLNWETRSLGKRSKNSLEKVRVSPLPLLQLSKIKLQPRSANAPVSNNITVNSIKKIYDFAFVADFNCQSETCFIGLDQSFDDGWIALQTKFGIRPHYKLNNWANIWEVNDSGSLLIIYWPELVSSLSLVMFVSLLSVLLILSRKQSAPKQNNFSRSRIKRALAGKKHS